MLLAAGLGTRLHPLSELRPKPIAPVANKPLAAFALEHLARSGARHIVANTHPQPEKVERELQTACPDGVRLAFSREKTLLGTGGGLRRARAFFDDLASPVLVMNGDTLFAPKLERAFAAHVAADAVATMILRRTPEPARFGSIGVDDAGRVRSLLGSPAVPVAEQLMFTGVHILSPEAFDAMPAEGCVIRTAYRGWVDQGATVLGIVDDSPWADLGTISEYHRVNLELASGSFRWPGVTPRDGSIISQDVELSPRFEQCVIGRGARIATGISLRRCVVWPGARVEHCAQNVIFADGRMVTVS